MSFGSKSQSRPSGSVGRSFRHTPNAMGGSLRVEFDDGHLGRT